MAKNGSSPTAEFAPKLECKNRKMVLLQSVHMMSLEMAH